MAVSKQTTGYARLTPRQARAVLVGVVMLAGLLVAVTFSSQRVNHIGQGRPGEGDVALYRAEIERIHSGEGYYPAAAAELTGRGYPTRSVFNWRTPLPMWLIGRLPSPVLGKAILGALALVLAGLAFEVLAREDGNDIRRAVGGVLLLSGPLVLCLLGDLFVMPTLWAGVLIALSITAFGLDRPRLGVGLGVAAVFFRELALPYVLLSAAIAWWQRRRGELRLWLLGLAAWIAFFAAHWTIVSQWITPDARAHAHGWLQFGGAGFVVATAQINAYLLLLPQWVTAVYLAAALLGFAGWHSPLAARAGLTACLFVTAFAVVGQQFNPYWGSLLAPLLCFGVVRSPASITDLWRAARTAPGGSGCSAVASPQRESGG